MVEKYTNAEEMARNQGVNGKSFRARLRRNHPNEHTPGSWNVVIDSDKHHLMQRELMQMLPGDAQVDRA